MYKYLVTLYFLSSCAYPDIDTVPDFLDVDLTKEESIDLCDFIYSDDINLKLDCIKKVKEEMLLKETTELCESKYSDIKLLNKCIIDLNMLKKRRNY